jgi:hypothetical protein
VIDGVRFAAGTYHFGGGRFGPQCTNVGKGIGLVSGSGDADDGHCWEDVG